MSRLSNTSLHSRAFGRFGSCPDTHSHSSTCKLPLRYFISTARWLADVSYRILNYPTIQILAFVRVSALISAICATARGPASCRCKTLLCKCCRSSTCRPRCRGVSLRRTPRCKRRRWQICQCLCRASKSLSRSLRTYLRSST